MSLIRAQIGVLSPIRITTVVRRVPHATMIVIRYVMVPIVGDRSCTVFHRITSSVFRQESKANTWPAQTRAVAEAFSPRR